MRGLYHEDEQDSRVWMLSRGGSLFVASFLSYLMGDQNHQGLWKVLWKMKAPPRVLAFGWLALRGCILTVDSLQRRKVLIVNLCPMCLAAEKTVDHLLVCPVAFQIWNSVLC